MKICIVIPHLRKDNNSDFLLRQCLGSLATIEPSMLPHTFVLDDGSVDPIPTEAICTSFGVSLLRSEVNQSFSRTVNAGMKFAKINKYEVVILINNDIVFAEKFTALISDLFEYHRTVSTIGVKLLFPDGRIQHDSYFVTSAKAINMLGRGQRVSTQGQNFVMGVTAAFMAIHLDRADDLFDEGYPLSYQDVHFCINQWLKGNRVLYTPQISAVHYESATRGYAVSPAETQSYARFINSDIDFESLRLQLHQAGSPHAQYVSQPLLQALSRHELGPQKPGHSHNASTNQAQPAQARNHLKLVRAPQE